MANEEIERLRIAINVDADQGINKIKTLNDLMERQNIILKTSRKTAKNGLLYTNSVTTIHKTADAVTQMNYRFSKTGKFLGATEKVTQNLSRKTRREMLKAGSSVETFGNKAKKSFNTTKKHIDNTSKSVVLLGKTLGSIAVTVSSVLGIGFSIGQAIEASNAYVENLNLFRVTFGEMTAEAERFVETYSRALGLDPSQVMREMGFFNQIVTGFGVTREEGYKMSKLLTQLSYDLSSFVNIPFEEAVLKFQSGIAGELEPLRRVGYALDEVTLQQTAYNMGIQKSIRSMTQQEKAYLRLWTMFEQSENVMGDLAGTLTSPANAMRILQNQATILKRSIGNALMPLLVKIVPIVQGAIKAITEFAELVAEKMGYEVMGNRENSYAEYMNQITQSAQEAEEALTSSLLSFDKFSVLDRSDDDASNLFTLPIPEYDALATLTDSLTKNSALMQKTYEALANILMEKDAEGNFIGINTGIKVMIELITKLGNLIGPVFDTFTTLLDHLVDMLTPFVKLLASIVEELEKMGSLIEILGLMLILAVVYKLTVGISNLVKTISTIGGLLNAGSGGTLAALGALVAVLYLVWGAISKWGDMSVAQKVATVIGILVASIFALVLAFSALKTAKVVGLFGLAAGLAIAGIAIGTTKRQIEQPVSIGGYATGGFTPETTGSLFMAGENGRPELMGTVKGKNAVANVNSIESAMEAASYRGMVSAITESNRGNNSTTPIILAIDGKELARANVRNTANALSRNYKVELNPR